MWCTDLSTQASGPHMWCTDLSTRASGPHGQYTDLGARASSPHGRYTDLGAPASGPHGQYTDLGTRDSGLHRRYTDLGARDSGPHMWCTDLSTRASGPHMWCTDLGAPASGPHERRTSCDPHQPYADDLIDERYVARGDRWQNGNQSTAARTVEKSGTRLCCSRFSLPSLRSSLLPSNLGSFMRHYASQSPALPGRWCIVAGSVLSCNHC